MSQPVRSFDFMGKGTFVLYRNKQLGTEIQTRQKACGGGFASCNCGVAIKENVFYKIYDMCFEDNSAAWWKGLVRVRKRYLRDYKRNGFYTTEKQEGESTIFEITLPSGIMVNIKRAFWGLSIYVYAPELAEYAHLSEGLCGNNNGDPNDDFGGKTKDEYAESMRVRGKSIFDYQGDKYLEDEIDEPGCDEKICLCQDTNTIKPICEEEAIKHCFPTVIENTYKDSKIGLCDNRKKRDLESGDDTVDDQDIIPPFDPPNNTISFVPKWPTPKGLTKTKVTDYCNKKIRFSQAGKMCEQITGVDMDTLVLQCISDIQMTEDFSWATDNFAALERTCTTNIYKNISLYQNNTDGNVERPVHLLAPLCPNDCSDHGNCSNSTCICDEFYTALDCSISLKDPPVVFDIQNSGLCDVRRRPCRSISIFGYPLLSSENLTCHINEIKIIDSTWKSEPSTTLYPGFLRDLTEVKCSLPVSPVNIGQYVSEGVSAGGLKIAVSNNRINASSVSVTFISFDSVCQVCNTTTGCKLKSEACFISGHCFSQNQSNPFDWCQQCIPDASNTSWTKRTENQPPIFQTPNILTAINGNVLSVKLRANDPENRTITYSFKQDSTMNATLKGDGLFTWKPTSSNSVFFTFKVEDECGAFSVLNASVIIKQCPCQNNGSCQPDARYLDGSGKFSCLCKPGYNGSLCELDINECLSSPCLKGNCSNEKPGFSCSCDPGYSGMVCDTDIDECLSSPCFTGVHCFDKVNGYECGPCPKGYNGTGETCYRIDGNIDDCIRSPEVCHSNANCTHINGSYVCQCSEGLFGDGKTNCTDINECKKSTNVCHQHANCSNTVGSYSCQCTKGYTGDGIINCTDFNECENSPTSCHQHANCSNIAGSYVCQCITGYTGDGKAHCSDINECRDYPNTCHQHAHCINTEGSYTCHCTTGYTGEGKTNCTDINECKKSPNVCHQRANCSNTEGSYSCQCTTGYTGDGIINCTDFNECENSPTSCHQHANCSNIAGSYVCHCITGHTGDGKAHCTDINECRDYPNTCHQHAHCINTEGSYTCHCTTGYTGEGKTNCTDINECKKSPNVCHQRANCSNTEGSYYCQCTTGYTGDGIINCTGFNECENSPTSCHQHANCSNIAGSYVCHCIAGFTGDGKAHCSDINECKDYPNTCHQHAHCINTEGSYTCHCTTGYTGDGKTNCTDIDEYTQFSGVSHQHANCINTEGTHSCRCTSGYTGDGKVDLRNINECKKSPNVCHQHANCSNTEGSYSCQCTTGYTGDGIINCTDFNECKNSPASCHQHANCSNIHGSYVCQCITGYTGDGKAHCSDINECRGYPNTCHQHAHCINTKGSYTCHCTTGYTGDGKTNCTDINECRDYPNTCHQHAHCINTMGSFTCHCTTGYTGAGKTNCTDINECIQFANICHQYADCSNNEGSYSCQCTRGYTGDGKVNCSLHNHCVTFPCFSGLKCLSTKNGYTCEECPKLFDGNGIYCVLKRTPETRSFNNTIQLTNEKWNDLLENKDSIPYKQLINRVTEEIRKVYSGHSEFVFVIITEFRRGSVVVVFELVFSKHVEYPFETLRKIVKNGKLGNMTVKMNFDEDKNDNEETIIGLSTPIFIVVIIVASVSLIILIAIIIFCVTRKGIKNGKKTADGKKDEGGYANQCALNFDPSMKNADSMFQEISLVGLKEGVYMGSEIKK